MSRPARWGGPSGRGAASPRRGAGAAILVAAALVLGAGCGDDEGRVTQESVDTATTPTTPESTPSETAPARTAPEQEREPAPPAPSKRPQPAPSAPEDQPGGAGDEVPISSQALLTGKGGRIRPRLVRVPPFIAVRVELRSADGERYSLRFGKRLIRVSAALPSVSRRFDGLRPGRRLVGRGSSGTVVIEASAEPGP